MAKTKTSAAVKNRYNEKAYDRITIVVPKGQKSTVEAAAKKDGDSVNQYVIGAVLAKMGLETWPELEALEDIEAGE